MKKIYITILALLIPTIVFAQVVLFPNRGGTGSESIPTIGQVLVGQSNGTYAPQATSSLGIAGGSGTVTQVTASSPLTGGTFTTSGTIGCQTASGSQAGCLSSTDWATFNNKLTSEILYAAASSTLLRFGTTTSWLGQWQSHDPSYFQIAGSYLTSATGVTTYNGSSGAVTGVSSLGSVTGAIATGTITCAGTASCGSGSYVLGGNLTITGAGSATGIGTSSPWTVNVSVVAFSGGSGNAYVYNPSTLVVTHYRATG